MRTKAAIIMGTLGRRIYLARYKLNAMQEANDHKGLSYQFGFLAGLLAAQEIFRTLETEEEGEGA